MYCKHCGSEMPDDAIFCSHCGAKLIAEEMPQQEAPAFEAEAPAVSAPAEPEVQPAPAAPAATVTAEEPPRKPFLEEMQWNVSEYPDSSVIEKTEDIDFNWNTDPDLIPDVVPRRPAPRPQPEPPRAPKSAEGIRVSEIFDRVVPAQEVKAAAARTSEPAEEGLDMSRFNTFNRKSAEFQQLLDQEYEKIRDAGTIGEEQIQADAIAKQKFDSRQEEMTMDQFLQREGAVKLYEPEPLQSDVLARIEAQEKLREKQKAEAEARARELEEARAAAEAERKAARDKVNSDEEASAAAAEEIRLAEEEEIRRRTEEEARRKAEAEAARLEAIAARRAEEEQKALKLEEERAAEEARRKAEEEQRAREEAEAKAKAEAEAARIAEEEARRKAEAELNAAREAARIRAQQEANMAAREEARFQAAQERARREEEARKQREAMQARQAQEEGAAKVEAEVRDALAQTARMREEEEAKIRAALAGIRGGRFTDTVANSEKAAQEAAEAKAEAVHVPTQTTEIPAAAILQAAAEEADQTAAEEAVQAAPVMTDAQDIEEAHRKTRDQMDNMAKARELFFADFPDAKEMTSRRETPDMAQTRMVDKDGLMAELDSTKKISRDELHLGAETDFFGQTVPAEEAPAAAEAAPAAPAVEEATAEAAPAAEEVIAEAVLAAESAPAQAQSAAGEGKERLEQKLSEIDDLLSQFASVSGAEPQAEAVQEEIPAEIPETEIPAAEETPTYHKFTESLVWPDMNADVSEEFITEEAPAFAEETAEAEIPAVEIPAAPAEEAPAIQEEVIPAVEIPAAPEEEIPAAPAVKEAPAAEIPAAPAAGSKPGLEDTMVMPMPHIDEPADWMDAGTVAQTAAAAGKPLSAKELKKLEKEKEKEAKRLAKEEKRAASAAVETYTPEDVQTKSKGGAGRVILMIILIILCLIFALELAGIGIKLLAPTSGAAEYIDNILNSIIHMITG